MPPLTIKTGDQMVVRIEALMARRAELDAKIQRLQNRDAEAERKARSRALLLLGTALEKQMKKEPATAGAVRQIIAGCLMPRDQETVLNYLFSPPTTASPKSEEQ